MRSTLESARLPPRVQHILERVLTLMSDDLARRLERMLADYEEQLFRHAEQARNPTQQTVHFETLRSVRVNRSDLIPRFLHELERSLSGIRRPAVKAAEAPHPVAGFGHLRLVEDEVVTEAGALRAMSVRHEARCSLPLLLLGQRFGVLAGSPAIEAEYLPVGPQQLSRIVAEASHVLQISQEARLELFHSFDTHVLGGYAHLVEALNGLLAQEGVLPNLSYVPLRTRPVNPVAAAASAQRAPAGQRAATPPAPALQRPHTGWLGDEDAGDGKDEDGVTFPLLQELLAGRSDLIGKLRPEVSPPLRQQMSPTDVQAALEAQQSLSRTPRPGPTGLSDLRQTLLAHGRRKYGEAITLSQEDSDAIELLGMLYAELARDVRRESSSSSLLERLQVPLLRVALQDHGFFARTHHPARQLLNAVAESGASWLADDERDPVLEDHLKRAVDHVVEHYRGDPSVFAAANQPLQDHLHAMARKAEVSERRHIEAARGKEKLEVSKRRAKEVLNQLIGPRVLPRFTHALLDQAWTDVLTLTLLRNGEDSEAWQRQQEDTRSIIAATCDGVAAPKGLEQRVMQGLGLVGYHGEEAALIAGRLCASGAQSSEDPGSRTELAMKLKARARLGEQAQNDKAPLPPRDEAEEACFQQVSQLPFGTWFEFVTNQQGDVVRRRLAWFSSITGHVLFVNQRGQRVDEQTLDSLARMMAKNQARVVTATRGRLIDRAWQATLSALRNFAHPARNAEVSK
ncbi:DUF1631 domain-containing protein [Aerolutibacter daejeonensis]|uniref:DUF1631 domain-containing protein n=1 Tax=Aerolutibacter daejeonensis TaxID=346181 RepID=UPI00068970B7|nr:DUF1631 domain-containing protein [Lysobacter daejeonensis]